MLKQHFVLKIPGTVSVVRNTLTCSYAEGLQSHIPRLLFLDLPFAVIHAVHANFTASKWWIDGLAGSGLEGLDRRMGFDHSTPAPCLRAAIMKRACDQAPAT